MKIKQKKFDKIKENGPKSKNNTLKKFEQKRDISIRKADDLIYNNKKIRVYNNTVDKITIFSVFMITGGVLIIGIEDMKFDFFYIFLFFS